MNLSEALDVALPEIPKSRTARSRPPRLDPDLIIREEVLDGEPIVGVLQRGKSNYFRFPPTHWQLAQLFDGVRSFEEISEASLAQTGEFFSPEELRAFAEQMDESDFWYKTHEEKNLAMSEKLMAQRGRRTKSKINLADIGFSAWDPNSYLTWLNDSVGDYIYSRWSLLAVLLLFVFETGVFVSHWSIIGPDTALYFNFGHKDLAAFAQFWILIFMLGFIHETAHGLTCKHYGGQVHQMGFLLMYFVPCFYCDVTEIWISASKVQRLATIIAGIWVEMTICGLAMVVWTNTSLGGWLHNFSYAVILLTGVAVVTINLNPLIKLDGYYFLAEVIEIPDLKERSTAFLTGWFQNRVLGLPVEVPIVPRRRAPLFFIYALVSGAYSYLLLFFFVRIIYSLASHWLAEFALLPAGIVAFYMFRSRLGALGRVSGQFWQQRFGSGMRWRPVHILLAAFLVAFLFLPIWRVRENAFFVIEPTRSLAVHAAVPGRVNSVLVQEGDTVQAGQPLLRMSSLSAASMESSAKAQTGSARFHAFTAQVNGLSIGPAAAEQNGAAHLSDLASDAKSSLVVAAPADGVVLTQNPGLLVNQDIGSGQPLLDLAGSGPRIARIFIPSSALERIFPGDEVSFALPGRFSIVRMTLTAPGVDAVNLPEGLVARQDYKGVKLPVFYCARMTLPASAGDPPLGVSGPAIIFGARRSLAARLLTGAFNLFKAHVW